MAKTPKAEAPEQHPTLTEAKVMFLENSGLDSVVITTEGGDARAFRDGRIELLPPAAE